MTTAPIQIHRLSFPLASVVALLITVVSGVWYLAQILRDLDDELDDRATVDQVDQIEERVDDLEAWRIEHTVRHPSQTPDEGH